MTPNEITTLIATEEKKELDVPYKKIIYERVKYWRSTLIKQSLDKVRQQARYFRQSIYMPMEQVNFLSLTAPVPLSNYRAKSTYRIPLPLRVADNGLFNYVGGIDGKSPFGFADAGTIDFLKADKYQKNSIYHEYIDGYIYIEEIPDLPLILIQGVFNEPEEAMKFRTGVYDPNVNWWDTDIPMSGDIEQRVVQCILTVDLNRPKPTKPEDYQVQLNGEQH